MAINNEIISTSWEGQQKSFIEAGLKTLLQRMLEVLESPLAANSVGSNQLTQELRDVINSIGSKVPNTRTVNGKELSSNITIGPDDIMVGNQTLSYVLEDTSGLASRIATLEQALDDLTGAEDTTQIIDTFNEVIDFLANVNNNETLLSKLLQLQTQINSKANDNAVVKSISVNGTAQSKDANGNVNVSVPTMTFDDVPKAGSNNPVKSGGIKTYVDGKASITGITTSQDGTFTIEQSDGNSYTVNLNHVHPQYLTEHQSLSGYAKFVLCQDEAEYNALATKDSSTLYLIPETT